MHNILSILAIIRAVDKFILASKNAIEAIDERFGYSFFRKILKTETVLRKLLFTDLRKTRL